MIKHALTAGAVLAGVLGATLPARAADDLSLLTFSGGWFDAMQQRHDAIEGRVEYRHGKGYWWIKPFGGAMLTSDWSSYFYAGILLDVQLTDHIYVVPSFAPGIYLHGDGRDLGGPVEFRSQIEVGWRFDDGTRAGVSLSHMSNADLYDSNPGVESLMLNISLPFGGGR